MSKRAVGLARIQRLHGPIKFETIQKLLKMGIIVIHTKSPQTTK